MTKKFNTTFTCQYCGRETTMETAFHRWVRNEPDLDSQRYHIVCGDIDLFIHRYMLPTENLYSREIQLMMFIEIKTWDKNLSLSQKDSLYLINQIFRNRRSNMHSEPRKQAKNYSPLTEVYSIQMKKYIKLRMYGGHFLKLSHDAPNNSEKMIWDNRWEISEKQLIKLMRFEIDPDNPNKGIDLRKHHKKDMNIMLPGL